MDIHIDRTGDSHSPASLVKDLGLLDPAGPERAFDAVILDFDGTIARSHHVWRMVDETFLSRRGIPYDETIGAQLAALGFEQGSVWIRDRYGLEDNPEAICDEWNDLAGELYRTQVTLRPGVEAYTDALHRAQVPVALATTNDAGVLEALKPRIDIDRLVDVRVHGAEVGVSKHHPDIYLAAAAKLGVAPERILVFEDIPFGLAACASAGFIPVGVFTDDPTQDKDAIMAVSAAYFDSWTEIPLS